MKKYIKFIVLSCILSIFSIVGCSKEESNPCNKDGTTVIESSELPGRVCPHYHGVLSGHPFQCNWCNCGYRMITIEDGNTIYWNSDSICITYTNTENQSFVFYTDSLGHWDDSNLEPNYYVVQASCYGYKTITTDIELEINDEGESNSQFNFHMVSL